MNHSELQKRVMKRIVQKGGFSCKTPTIKIPGFPSPGQQQFSSSGKLSNLIKQFTHGVSNGIQSMSSGLGAVCSILTLPADLGHTIGKPNEPMPYNVSI